MRWTVPLTLLFGLTACGANSIDEATSNGGTKTGHDGGGTAPGQGGMASSGAGGANPVVGSPGGGGIDSVVMKPGGGGVDSSLGVGGSVTGVGNTCPGPGTPPTGVNIALHNHYPPGSANFENAGVVFDGDLATATPGVPNKDGLLAVDFGAAKELYRTVIHFAQYTPQRYKLQGSNDASVWTDILRVFNPNYTDDRLLPRSNYRYLRMVVYETSGKGEDPNVLQPVAEMEVYEKAADDPPGCAPIVYPEPIDRKAWVVTSSSGSAQAAVASEQQGLVDPHGTYDGPSHWLNHDALMVGSYVQVDMGSVQTFNQIYTSSDHDVMREYAIYVSDDGISWGTPLVNGTIVPIGGHEYEPFKFPTQRKRYFKIESRFDLPSRWWGYHNISALNVEEPPEDKVNIALNKPTTGSAVKDPGAVFDGNEATGTDDAGTIQVDLGSVLPIGHIKVKYALIDAGFTYDIQTSNDGTTWDLRQTFFVDHGIPHPLTHLIRASYSTRYLKFVFKPSHPHNADVPQNVKEIEVYQGGP